MIAHCPYCSKDVRVTAKGRLAPHLTPGGQTCFVPEAGPDQRTPPKRPHGITQRHPGRPHRKSGKH